MNQIIPSKKEEVFKIPIDGIFDDFAENLDIENNNNIFFSGKFGIGKTYFLKEFFNNSEDYEVFHLFPVNYQIHKNEDILELMKYDILTELINKNPNIFKENKINDFIDLRNLIYIWGKDNSNEIIKTMLSNIPKLGKSLKDVSLLVDKFLAFKKQMEGSEKLVIEDFFNNINKKIDETDTISELIKNKLNKIKDGKKSVLILDDLDRIDPEHIFRILNIFSAYFEKETGNKFGFDKIILVGDVKNIKNIFHHKYGVDTDFNGYFDKYFSIGVYLFNNDKALIDNLDKIILNIKYKDTEFINAMSGNGHINLFLAEILRQAIFIKSKNKLNLRQLLKGVEYQIPALLKYKENTHRDGDSAILRTITETAITIFGGTQDNLLEVLEEILENKEFLRTDGRVPYNFYSLIFLYKIHGKTALEKRKDKPINFNNHSIDLTDMVVQEMRDNPIKTDDSVGLFYELFINHIKRDLYKN